MSGCFSYKEGKTIVMVKSAGTENKMLPEYFSRGKLSPECSPVAGSLVPSTARFKEAVAKASGAFSKGGDNRHPRLT